MTNSGNEGGSEMFLTIAEAMKREARVVEHHDGFPRCEGRGVIYAPEGRTIEELYILAHECGHSAFRHGPRSRKPKWRCEYEAETWAHDAFRRHGLAVDKAQTKLARANVRAELSIAWDLEPMQLAMQAAKWCGASLPDHGGGGGNAIHGRSPRPLVLNPKRKIAWGALPSVAALSP